MYMILITLFRRCLEKRGYTVLCPLELEQITQPLEHEARYKGTISDALRAVVRSQAKDLDVAHRAIRTREYTIMALSVALDDAEDELGSDT